MQSSRLTRTTKERNKKQIMFFGFAIIALLFIFFQFGPYLLNLSGSFMSGLNKPSDKIIANENNTLETPFINSIPEATNSARIHIQGTSVYSDAQVELYVNGSSFDDITLSDDQKFTFKDVNLREGANIIKVRVKKGDLASDFSRNYIVEYSAGDTKLEVSSPTEGATFGRGDQTINVTGKTDPDSSISVNGSVAVVDADGNFSYFLSLSDGDNTISIDAQSAGGKTTNKSIKVTYKP